jgi:hypothetical protein
MERSEAIPVMEEANRIIEDFPTAKYAWYMFIFGIEIVLCFLIGLNL